MSPRVIICGGGTGGHVFPAIAIANALKKIDVNTELLFVGAKDKMEMEKVPAAGYKIEGLWISGFQRSLSLRNLSFPFKLIDSLMKARSIIKRFRPDVVVGVGGYSSGPVLYMASRKGIPTLIQEQNSYAGITNKILSKRVKKVCVAYDGMERFFPKDKVLLTGNPVRAAITAMKVTREESLAHFGLDKNKLTVLSIGGSLGAKTINESLAAQLDRFEEKGIQLLWQTGKPYFEQAKQAASGKANIKVHDFITRMDYAYTAADLIISRAGAIAVSELYLVGKPVILVPFPYAAEDHQRMNALSLVEKEAAIMVLDKDARQDLIPILMQLHDNKPQQHNLSQNIKKLGIPDAANRIAQEVLNLVR